MATSYFDAKEESHRNLLPLGYRAHQDLANAAASAEADVIAHYTQKPPYTLYTAGQLALLSYADQPDTIVSVDSGGGEDVTATGAPEGAVVPQVRVYLAGYKADAADAKVDANLKVALRRTVAAVVAWRLVQWTKIEPGVESSSADGKSRGFRATAEDAFPPGWDRWLTPYDSRPVAWGL